MPVLRLLLITPRADNQHLDNPGMAQECDIRTCYHDIRKAKSEGPEKGYVRVRIAESAPGLPTEVSRQSAVRHRIRVSNAGRGSSLPIMLDILNQISTKSRCSVRALGSLGWPSLCQCKDRL
jgi:hypothetical protein